MYETPHGRRLPAGTAQPATCTTNIHSSYYIPALSLYRLLVRVRPNKAHYKFCPSVRLSVCSVRAYNVITTKRRNKTKIGINATQACVESEAKVARQTSKPFAIWLFHFFAISTIFCLFAADLLYQPPATTVFFCFSPLLLPLSEINSQ